MVSVKSNEYKQEIQLKYLTNFNLYPYLMILTINCGSSSVKYSLFSNTLKCILRGYKENIKSHEDAIQEIINELSPEQIKSITQVGHRVAHG